MTKFGWPQSAIVSVFGLIQWMLECLMAGYDLVVYTPLQKSLSPLVAKIPRKFNIFGRTLNIFTANNVTFGRTLLFIPVSLCLKYGYSYTACGLVLFQDFLDDLDGIVAKTQRKIYGPTVDDPLLGAYLDPICDKIVFFMVMLAIFLVAPLHHMTFLQLAVFVGICAVVMSYEVALGIVRTNDYYEAHYQKQLLGNSPKSAIEASMAGKVKEKLMAISETLLCLAVVKHNPLDTGVGIVAMVTLSLSIWFAHQSLRHKLEVRKLNKMKKAAVSSANGQN